jgi:hypothetical protein
LTVSKLHLGECRFVPHRSCFSHCENIIVSPASPKKMQFATRRDFQLCRILLIDAGWIVAANNGDWG